jgi:tetratricopeptide (TPR) repeat protein
MKRLMTGLAITIVAFAAYGQTSDEMMCMSSDPSTKISGCTAVIESRQETPASRAVAYSNRGSAYARKGLYDKAISDLTKAIALAPDSAGPYNERAWAWHLMGLDAKGLPDANKAVELTPNDADSFETRAEISEKLGQRDQAIIDYRKTLKLSPSNTEAGHDALSGLRRLHSSP